jgi:hypothetical protein
MTGDSVVRLLLRFLLVPLGFCAAALAGTLVIVASSLHLVEAALSGHPDGLAYALWGFIIGGWIVGIFVIVFVALPASIGILISEAFAIRSWIFHALNGAVSAWLGLQLYEATVGYDQPLVIVAAGLAGGFAYWAVAGFSAGFWKPVFRRSEASAPAIPR